jgi:hypothetical protein
MYVQSLHKLYAMDFRTTFYLINDAILEASHDGQKPISLSYLPYATFSRRDDTTRAVGWRGRSTPPAMPSHLTACWSAFHALHLQIRQEISILEHTRTSLAS